MRRGKIGGSKESIEGSLLFVSLFLPPSLPPSLSYAFPLPLSSFQFHPLYYHSVFLAVLLRFCEGKASARLPGYRHTHRLEASFNYKNPVVLCPFIFTTFFENLALSLSLSRHTNSCSIRFHCFLRQGVRPPSSRTRWTDREFSNVVVKSFYIFFLFSFFMEERRKVPATENKRSANFTFVFLPIQVPIPST